MALLISANLFFVTLGGQLTAMVVDCVEGLISGLMLLALMIGVCYVFKWNQMATAMTSMPPGHSLINPFDAFKTQDFNIVYVLLGLVSGIYGYMAWQGNSGFNSSAFNPQEAKMGKVLGQWRMFARSCSLTLLAFGAMTYMHHPSFFTSWSCERECRGCFCCEADSPQPDRSYLSRYGSTFLMESGRACLPPLCSLPPWRAIPATYTPGAAFSCRMSCCPHPPGRAIDHRCPPEQHLRWLRRSIIGVGFFAFGFGILWTQDDYILMFMAVTGAIFLGGAGSCIVGGLYWSRGTTAPARGRKCSRRINTGGGRHHPCAAGSSSALSSQRAIHLHDRDGLFDLCLCLRFTRHVPPSSRYGEAAASGSLCC